MVLLRPPARLRWFSVVIWVYTSGKSRVCVKVGGRRGFIMRFLFCKKHVPSHRPSHSHIHTISLTLLVVHHPISPLPLTFIIPSPTITNNNIITTQGGYHFTSICNYASPFPSPLPPFVPPSIPPYLSLSHPLLLITTY